MELTRTNVCKASVVDIKCGAIAKPDVEYYQLYENNVQIGNESKYGAWNKTMSKEGELSYTRVAKNSEGRGNSSSLNVTLSAHSTILSISNHSHGVLEGSDATLL